MLTALGFKLMRYSGLPFLVREAIQRRRVTIVLFHDIEPGPFEAHIRLLKQTYNLIGLQDYLRARKDKTFRLPPKALVITLDDGHMGNYALLDVIRRHKVPVTIFLCSSIAGTGRRFWFTRDVPDYSTEDLKKLPVAERNRILGEAGQENAGESAGREALSRAEILEMSAYVDFQSHTKLHPNLPQCTAAEAEDEIAGSRRELEETFGFRINALSYPNGDYSARDLRLARAAGYELGITVDAGYNTLTTDPFRLKRLDLNDTANTDEMMAKVSGAWQLLRGLVKRPSYGYGNAID